MNWRKAPVIIVTGIYLVQAGIFACTRSWAQATIFFGYALANLGVIAAL